MNEIWKPIDGTYCRYEVSSLGRVRSTFHAFEKILKQSTDENGYKRCRISIDGKQKTINVHKEVAKAFIPNPDNLETVNHINEIKDDNRVENLEWLSARDNILKYANNHNIEYRHILIIDYSSTVRYSFDSVNKAAKTLHVSHYKICNCIKYGLPLVIDGELMKIISKQHSIGALFLGFP